ncbi:GNAT family N-acetyltransferase [Tenggerimyces flavus]|uniref:GNAT family N-acetyltransferase n=1 Tax=Tenggerimyces flavus TaxID=1708749 RepID=A0ABV7YIW3_9ACTN|nr:GNAT family N-acetyltransferase [Tenggerimyces flavus]MBM7787672.1 RimJ/RimL family protein N-acetyltransferase [Tenggerimyces flavus]
MIPLSAARLAELRPWIDAEPLSSRRQVAQHVAYTGVGMAFADRCPEPRVLLFQLDTNYALLGDPDAVTVTAPDLAALRGPIAAASSFEPVLRAAFPSLQVRPRLMQRLSREPAEVTPRAGEVRRLESAADLAGFGSPWVAASWGGPEGLARSGRAWGGYLDGTLVSVACAFLQAEAEEELGVATEPAAQGLGLSTACAANVCRDILGRGRIATWTTAADNVPSLRVATKLGFGDPLADLLFATA